MSTPAPPELNGAPPGTVNGVVVDLDAAPKQDAPVGCVELFRLGGRVYTIPEKARFNVALKYLWLAKLQGEELAGQWMLEELIGTDAYKALMDYDDLSADQFAQIMTEAQRVVLGTLETGKA